MTFASHHCTSFCRMAIVGVKGHLRDPFSLMGAFELMEAILWRERSLLPGFLDSFFPLWAPSSLLYPPPSGALSLSLCSLGEVTHSNTCGGQAGNGNEGGKQPDGASALDSMALRGDCCFPSSHRVMSHKGEHSLLSDFLVCQGKLKVGIFVWNYRIFKSWQPTHILKL